MESSGFQGFWNGCAEMFWLLVKIEVFAKIRIDRKTCKFPSAGLQLLKVIAQKK